MLIKARICSTNIENYIFISRKACFSKTRNITYMTNKIFVRKSMSSFEIIVSVLKNHEEIRHHVPF